MPNPLHASVPITIDGAEYFLRYEHKDFAKAEGYLGFALIGPDSVAFWGKPDAYKTSVLLYVGMAHKMPAKFTVDDAFDLITMQNARDVQAQVMKAFEQFMPEPKKDGGSAEPDPLATAPASTGTEPSPSPASPSA